MSINRIISEESRRGPTIRQRLAAGALILALGFTSACGTMNRQYTQAEHDAGPDAVAADVVDADLDAGQVLPAGVSDQDLYAAVPRADAGMEPDAAAQPDDQAPAQAGYGNGCLETRFNMHYNSTRFTDADAETDIRDFVRSVARSGHDQLYIAGFASVENRGDRINNDAPYNNWLANQRANRVLDIVQDTIRHDRLTIEVLARSYAETDEFGSRLSDNRAVVLTTRALPDPDADAAVAAQIRSHRPGETYTVSCEVAEQEVAYRDETPAPRPSPRAARAPARVSAHSAHAHNSVEAVVRDTELIRAIPEVYRQMGLEDQRAVREDPAPAAQDSPIIREDGIRIYFGIDPLAPSTTVAPDGFIESGPAHVVPEPITPSRQVEPPAEPQPAIPPASIRGAGATSMYGPQQGYTISETDVRAIEQSVSRLATYSARAGTPNSLDDAIRNLDMSLQTLDDAVTGFRSNQAYETRSYLG